MHALTSLVVPDNNHIRGFWSSVELVTKAMIRKVLNQYDDEESISFSMNRLRELFIGALEYQPQTGKIKEFEKSILHIEYRYVVNLVMNSLSPRNGGLSKISCEYANVVVAILYILNFNFSRMIFNGFKTNVTNPKEAEKFLLYPRFLNDYK